MLEKGKRLRMDGGSVILLCLGVLALLSLLGSAVMLMAKHEEKQSRIFIHQTMARFAAESGVENAFAMLCKPGHDAVGKLPDAEAYPDSPGLDIEYLLGSSFGRHDLDGDGLNETAGYVSETYAPKGDRYKLRVEYNQGRLNLNDTNSFLNVDNDPYGDQISADWNYSQWPAHLKNAATGDKDPDWIYPDDADYVNGRAPGNKPYPRAGGRLTQIFKELLYVLFGDDGLETSWTGNTVWAENTANRLFDARLSLPADRFDSFDDLKQILVAPGFLSGAQFSVLRAFITLDAWQDDTVLLPTFQWQISLPRSHPQYFPGDANYGFLTALLHGLHQPPAATTHVRPNFCDVENGNNNSEDIYLYSDMQTKYFKLDKRSPIDLNSAGLPLIRALTRPLSGWWLKEAPTPDEPAETVSNWTLPNFHHGTFMQQRAHHKWFYDYRRFFVLIGSLPSANSAEVMGFTRLEKNRFYYYDEYEKAYLFYTGDKGLLYANAPNGVNFGYARKNSRFGCLKKQVLGEGVADELSRKLYERMHPDANGDGSPDSFNPFRTWPEFEYFVRSFVDEGQPGAIPGFRDVMADLVIANFNPNSRINDYNSNKAAHLVIDKSQLEHFSTEFVFHECGIYSIESYGRVLDSKSRELAGVGVMTVAKLMEVFRVSSQAKFMEGYDPADPNRQSKEYLGASSFDSSGLDFVGGAPNPLYTGNTLQSYPEPELSDSSRNYIRASIFDGSLMLSTLRPALGDLFSGHSADFIADFDGTLHSRLSPVGIPTLGMSDAQNTLWIGEAYHNTAIAVSGQLAMWAADSSAQVPGNYPEARRLTHSREEYLLNKEGYFVSGQGREFDTLPGNLYPDGAFSDSGRSISFDARNIGDATVKGRRGSLQFWIKPAFDVAQANRIRQFFSLSPKYVDPLIQSNGTISVVNSSVPGVDREVRRDFSLHYFPHGNLFVEYQPNLVLPLNDDALPVYLPSQYHEWISTRSLYWQALDPNPTLAPGLYGGFVPAEFPTALGTSSVSQSWRKPFALNSGLQSQYFMETRIWSQIGLGWNLTQPVGNPSSILLRMTVNGRPVDEPRQMLGDSDLNFNLHWKDETAGIPNYVRFGESSSAPFNNDPADSTYDLIVSSKFEFDSMTLGDEYSYSRYYPESDACYTSPEYDLFNQFEINAGNLLLHSIFWTGYLPLHSDLNKPADSPRWNENRAALPEVFVDYSCGVKFLNASGGSADGFPNDPLFDMGVWQNCAVPFSIDIWDSNFGATGGWYYEVQGLNSLMKPNYAGGSMDDDWLSNPLVLRSSVKQKFRFKVHFNTDPYTPIFSSQILDDISFLFILSRPRILSWNLN